MGSVPAIPLIADSTVFGKTYDARLKTHRQSMASNSTPVSQRSMSMPVGNKCWAELMVKPASTDVRAVGVVQPGSSVSSASAASSREAGWSGCAAILAVFTVIIVVTVAVSAMNYGWSDRAIRVTLAWLALLSGLAALIVVWKLSDRKAKAKSKLVTNKDPAFDVMLHGMKRLGQITCAIDDFDAKMRECAKQAHLEPLTLPNSLRAAPEGIHVTLWEIAGHGEQPDQVSITAGMEALTKVVFDTIETTWATFEGFIVPIPAAPDELTVEPRSKPKPPTVDPVRLLKEITEQIETDREAAEQTNQEIARINRPETGPGS